MEAVQALCPVEWKIYTEGGADLAQAIEAALTGDLRYDPFLPPTKHDWLSDCLANAIAQRHDIDITGVNLAFGLQSSRVSIPPDLIKLSIENRKKPSVFLGFIFEENSALVSLRTLTFIPEIEEYEMEEFKLHRVKVQSSIITTPNGQKPSQKEDSHPQFSVAHLRGWYRLRVSGWPQDKRPPTEKEDHTAAEAEYGIKIPRRDIRALRKELASLTWKKPGPRGPRNSRRGAN